MAQASINGFLLDSNTVIALMAGDDLVMRRVRSTALNGGVATSSIVLFELLFGAFNSARVQDNLARLAKLALPAIEFDVNDARHAGEVRAQLKRVGTPIGPYDVMIAGQALARDMTVVTANRREFDRVDGLRVEDWTIPG